MIYYCERRKLLKIGKILFFGNEILEGEDVIDALRLCNKEGFVIVNDKNLKIQKINFFPLSTEMKDEKISTFLDLNAQPVCFYYNDYSKELTPLILETTLYSYETLEEMIECKNNQALLGVSRLYLSESCIEKVRFITGEKVMENLEMCNNQGEFYFDNKFLGKIGSLEFSDLRKKPVAYSHPIFMTFREYVELNKPPYILITKKNISYKNLNYNSKHKNPKKEKTAEF